MTAKLKHLAIVSDDPGRLGRFYQELFGLKGALPASPISAASMSDGYLGLNVNFRVPGRQAGLDHFGFEVEAVEPVFERLRTLYPQVSVLRRPGNRPFAGISTHDPAGNVFDLSQPQMGNRRGIYAQDVRDQDRRVDHIVLRAVDPAGVARFYLDVLDLMELERPPSDTSFYLSDGRVTFVIAPWQIADYEGSGIERPALDHVGFRVESVDAVREELGDLAAQHQDLAPRPWKTGAEGEARHLLLSACTNGAYQFSDPDGVLVDVTEHAYL